MPFEYEGNQVRAIIRDDEPWWVARDVCLALGYSAPASAVRNHVDREDRGVSVQHTLGGEQRVTVINESGLYALIFGSKLEKARGFKRWVTSDVLPALRKTGTYSMPGTNLPEAPKTFADVLELAAKQARAIEEMAPRAELLQLFEDAREGMSIADVGALFGYKPHQFHEMARIMGATCHDKRGRVRGSQFWLNKDWLRSRRNGDHGTPAVTPKGLAEFERRFGRQVVGSTRPAIED